MEPNAMIPECNHAPRYPRTALIHVCRDCEVQLKWVRCEACKGGGLHAEKYERCTACDGTGTARWEAAP